VSTGLKEVCKACGHTQDCHDYGTGFCFESADLDHPDNGQCDCPGFVAEGEEFLTPAQAQAAYDAAEPVPLSKERIDQIVEYATDPRRCDKCYQSPSDLERWKRLAVLLDKTWTERTCSSEQIREIDALWAQLGGRPPEET
jgi:hypothetical protein